MLAKVSVCVCSCQCVYRLQWGLTKSIGKLLEKTCTDILANQAVRSHAVTAERRCVQTQNRRESNGQC